MNTLVDTLRSLRLVHWMFFAVVAIGVFTGVYAQVTSSACYPGTILGRSCYRGYFNNVDDRGGDNVLPIIKNGQAIPSSDINNYDQFYNLVKAAYDSGNAQKRTGAAFIYNTMTAPATAPGIGKNITNDQWLNLRERLRGLDEAGKIEWGVNVSSSINSYWQGTNEGFNPDGTNDDNAFYGENKNEPGIRIRNYENVVVYELLRRCANPVGNPQGIPQPKNYALTPHIDEVSPTPLESESKVSVGSGVNNVGEAASQPTQWEITQITVQPGKLAPHENEGPSTISVEAPCQSSGGAPAGNYFDSGDADCKNVGKGVGTFAIGNTTLTPLSGLDVADLPVGSRLCFALSVQPRSNTDGAWAHSQPICAIVGKKPKIQIWGGDVAVRGKVETSTSVKDVSGTTKTFGSWVEYGVFAVGKVDRFASGSGLVNQTDNNQAAWSKLTFANKNQAGADSFGEYTTSFRPIVGIAAFFSTQPQSPVGAGSADLGSPSLTFDTGGAVTVRTAGNLTVTRSVIPKGKSTIIIASGTVTIDDDITYLASDDEALASTKDIPQVVIIAKDILIKDKVKRVDAWLVASGLINTCSDLVGVLNSTKCTSLLEINGPVVTGRLLLNRTAGSGTGDQSGDPAERFNLRPDAYVWAELQSVGNNKAQTVYSTELPPRF